MLEVLILNALLVLMALISLALAAWALLSGHAAKDSFDGTFLFLGSVLLAIVFSINPILAWQQGLLRDAVANVVLPVIDRLSQKLRAARAGQRRPVSMGQEAI
jgi:hypothetical protein